MFEINRISGYSPQTLEDKMIKLMADSTCDLSQEILDKYEISIASLLITIDGKE